MKHELLTYMELVELLRHSIGLTASFMRNFEDGGVQNC